jgi:dethiobiotin synthetase
MHRAKAYFVTGTDTGVGKTYACCALLHAARRQGLRALAMKPVAAGIETDRRNEDVERLLAAASAPAERALVNPFCFAEPVAPHIAAEREGRTIEAEPILSAFDRLRTAADLLLVEGVGGFRVPLSPTFDTADLAQRLALPVILVVGLRLGCLNHALLSAEAIAARGLPLAGWIANHIDPGMPCWQDNLAALRQRLAAPLLGLLPWQAEAAPEQAAGLLALP